MVLIEPQEEDNQPTLANNPPNPKPFTPSDSGSVTPQPPAATSVNGNESDGFETASEHGLSDNEELSSEDQQQQLGQELAEVALEDSIENDEESKQKALEQANDRKLEGNKLFGEERYEDALIQYELALEVAPDMPSSVELRSICHSNRGVCFLKLGKYEDTIKECTKALELNSSYVKALVRRGEAHEKLEHFDEAIADMKKILELDPSNLQAKKAIFRLEPLAAEKREKLKEEMIAKAKDIGNVLLGKVGLSIDNFKAIKDPNTGSYSISFQR
ncbi:Tetratricopeptide repeat protein 1 [Euphorbia peplus]|nr:Tetratricopeptide repeat protein 1 [Euphorbia peplus]